MIMNMDEPEIIYKNDDFIIVNKPAGLTVHKGVGVKGKTLTDFLLEKFPEIKTVGDPSTSSGQVNLRPGIAHRLDRDTSGVMIVARNQKTFEDLKQLFQQRKMEKKYLALVCGEVKNKKGIIESPIGRTKKNPMKRGVGPHIRGERQAITEYRTLKHFGKNFTLLEVIPKTGRMHQIRVHLKSIGHPVVGDKIYGGKNICSPEGLDRMFLHASSIEFSYPGGKRWHFEADLPEDLKEALGTCENP